MNAHADISLTRGDTSPNSLVEGFTGDREYEPGNTALNGDNLNSFPSNANLSLVTNGSDIVVHEGRSPIHPFKSDREPSDVKTARNVIDQEHDRVHSQSNSNQVILPAISKGVLPSDRAVLPAGGSTSLIKINDSEAHTIVHPQEAPLLRARTVSATAPREPSEADSGDPLKCIQMLHTDSDHVHSDDFARLIDEEETREDFDYPCEDPVSSLPPSSSPPQLFSSSPYASSQSSASGIEPTKMVLAVEVEDCASFQDGPNGDHVVSVAQDESRSESKKLHSHDNTDIVTSPETDESCLQMDPTAHIEGGLAFRKRIGYQNDLDESYESQPIKRLKLDSGFLLPPTPKRATLASQHRQFKKLAAPFRPPSKLPVVMNETQIVNNREAELTNNATRHDKIDMKEPIAHLSYSQNKAPNTSRSSTQFKSPLVNRDLPANSRTIRLTPALQALERRLQLLKRATKVKEEKEEEVLIRLAEKWIEAGREVAYDVWNATKDAGDLDGKTFIHRSYGWESTNNGNTPWGWDTKQGDTREESCDLEPSVAPCGAGRVVHEEDEVGCNTLGTMLRQLGIAPEILGWDDDKEAFSD